MFEHVQAGQEFKAPSAFEWNAMLDAGRAALAGGTGISSSPAGAVSPQACIVRIKNVSGQARQRYECLTLGAPRWQLAAKHNLAGIVLGGETADPEGPPAVLLEPLADDRIGYAVCLGPTVLRMNSFSGSAKLFAAPNANGRFDSADSGPIRLISATSGQYGFGVLGSASSAAGHFLFTLTGAMSAGEGEATIRNMADSAEIATGVSVKDPLGLFEGLASGRRGICVLDGSEYYAIGPYVTRVRWWTRNLESSHDGGATWDKIDTGEPC